MRQEKKTTIRVVGMHCDSCDILVKQKFSEQKNVVDVRPDHATQMVEVTYTGTLDKRALHNKVSQYGYSVLGHKESINKNESSNALAETGAIAVIVLIAYYFIRELQLPSVMATPSQLSYLGAFFLGIVASLSTCMATSGALFASTVGSFKSSTSTVRDTIVPAVSFNVGRVLSYGVFGFLAGLIGNSVLHSLQWGIALNVFISVILLFIAIDMLQLFSTSMFTRIPFTKQLFVYLQQKLNANPKRTAFILGAITYLLPCGFTQTVQLYALGLADPLKSAITMTSFAVGTVPVLLSFGFVSSVMKSSVYRQLSKAVAVVIVLISLSYISNALHLYGISLPWSTPQTTVVQAGSNVMMRDGYQVATMNANARGYYPNTFTIKQGIPVRWVVKGENIYGCQGELIAPKIAVQKTLTTGENIIEFTPEEKGLISFSCTMGMFQGRFNVI